MQYGYTILCRTVRQFVVPNSYLSTSISNPDLNSTVSLFSYTVIFSTSLRTNGSSYANGSFTCFSKNPLPPAVLLRILCQNILPLLPQFINVIRNISIFLFAVCQPQKLLLLFSQSAVNLRNLLPVFALQHPSDILL